MKIGVIVQARTSSTRLPQKVLKELPFGSGISSLQQIIRRLKQSKVIHTIILATTEERSDDPIIDIAKIEHVKFFRGSLTDVLARYYLAAKENELDVIVRITGDCPCIDAAIMDMVINKHLEEQTDYTANVLTRSFPDGLDVEVFNVDVLEKMHHQADQPDEREHVTAYIFKHQQDFAVFNIEASEEFYAPVRRITLDTAQDYALLCTVYDELYATNQYFDARAIMKLFKDKPWLDWINTPYEAS